MRRFSFLLLVVLSYSACKNDDDMVVIMPPPPPPVDCEGGVNYSIDFRPESIHERNLWLSDEEGNLAADEEVDTAPAGIQFLTFANACEDQYTLSVGYYDTDENPYPGDYAKILRVREYASVASGSRIDLQAAGGQTNTFRGLMPNWLIVIPNCPPVDSAFLQVVLDSNAPNPPTLLYYFDYYPEDSTLVLYTEEAGVTASQGLMAIRDANTGQWLGELLDFRNELPTELAYDNLQPLGLRSTDVQWPTDATEVELEISWIHNLGARQATVLAYRAADGNIEVPVPAMADGPYVVTARWQDEQQRELRYVLDEWPTALNISSSLQGEVVRFDYPDIDIHTSGIGIVSVLGSIETVSGYYAERQHLAEAKEGAQQIRFAPLSPALEAKDPDVRSLYDQSFEGFSRLDLYYYPETDGTYSWYFRNVLSEVSGSEAWLKSLAYERLIVPFN